MMKGKGICLTIFFILIGVPVCLIVGSCESSDDGMVSYSVEPMSKIYVVNSGEGSVSVIDPATNKVIKTITAGIGREPFDLVCTLDTDRIYVANEDDGDGISISVIDGEDDEVIETITIAYQAGKDLDNKGHSEPHFIAAAPDGEHILLTTSANQSVNIFEANDNADEVTVVEVELFTSDPPHRGTFAMTRPHGIAVIPGFAYIANEETDDVSVVDLETKTLVGSPIPVDEEPTGCAATPDGKWVLVCCPDSGTISIIRTSDNTLETNLDITTGGKNQNIAIAPNGKRAYVPLTSMHNVAVINIEDADPGNWTVENYITVGLNPYGVIVSPDSKKLYVVNMGSNNISVIDTEMEMVTAWIEVGKAPMGITYCFHRGEGSGGGHGGH